MLSLTCSSALYDAFLEDMRGEREHIGFFIGGFEANSGFHLVEWRPVPPEGYELQTDYHASLTDEAQAEAIQWGFDSGLSLIEAHAHRFDQLATFSPSDRAGLLEWVPHVRWRLSNRPYAAVVVAGASWDGLAWVNGPQDFLPLDSWKVDGQAISSPTGHGLKRGGEPWAKP